MEALRDKTLNWMASAECAKRLQLHRSKMTPNSSVFGQCVKFGLSRWHALRWGCQFSIRCGPRTEHVGGLLQRSNILDSLSWRVSDILDSLN